MQPLEGVKVLDFSTLLPGPMATLILAEAGAEVIKVERPGVGDEARMNEPKFGSASVNYAVLNRGKKSVTIDLKAADAIEKLTPLIKEIDIVVEQFRPGVMQRLGLDYESLKKINPKIIYCAITGYGQTGPMAGDAGHDLNYQARTGMLGISAGSDGAPVVPPVLIADLAGGTYPSVVNILLALRRRDLSGEGAFIDIAMTDNLFPLMYWAMGAGEASGQWPRPGGERVTGGSPRYGIYRTADDKFVAAAPLEQRFWVNFARIIELPDEYFDDDGDWPRTQKKVAELIATQDAEHWRASFEGQDVCACIIESLETAFNEEQFRGRGLFDYRVQAPTGESMTAMAVPVEHQFRGGKGSKPYPDLGADNDIFDDG